MNRESKQDDLYCLSHGQARRPGRNIDHAVASHHGRKRTRRMDLCAALGQIDFSSAKTGTEKAPSRTCFRKGRLQNCGKSLFKICWTSLKLSDCGPGKKLEGSRCSKGVSGKTEHGFTVAEKRHGRRTGLHGNPVKQQFAVEQMADLRHAILFSDRYTTGSDQECTGIQSVKNDICNLPGIVRTCWKGAGQGTQFPDPGTEQGLIAVVDFSRTKRSTNLLQFISGG